MMRAFHYLTLPLTCLLLTSLPAEEKPDDVTKAEESWPVFRGTSLQTGVYGGKLPETLKELWTFKADEAVECTAAIDKGTVYVASAKGTLYALDLKSGEKKWTYQAGPVRSPAAVHEGMVFVGDEDGFLHCVDASNGEKKWTFETQGEISSGCAFTKGHVLFGSGDENLYCLTLDGKKKWSFAVEGGPVKATPSIVGNRTFVAGCDSELHVINIEDGKEVSATALDGQVGATAAVDDAMLYVGTMTDEVLAIDWKESKIKWRFQPERGRQPFYASVALTDKQVIAGCRNRRIYGLNRESGKEEWSFLTGNRIEGSPVVAGDRVYAPSTDGHLYVLDLAKKGALVQKIQLDDASYSSPAVAQNRLILGTEKGTVYCFGEK